MHLSSNQSQAVLRYFSDDAQVIFFLLNTDGKVLSVNNHCQELLGDAVPGCNFQDVLANVPQNFSLEDYSSTNTEKFLLSLEIPGDLPRSYYFSFRKVDDSILVFGESDEEELEMFRSQILTANQELNNLTRTLHKKNSIISQEKSKYEKLLLNILPGKIVDDLKKFGKTIPQTFQNVTIFFSDIVGFTNLSSEIEPQQLVSGLNTLFTAFDNIMEENHCERIKTIGDAYIAVCGMPAPTPDHAKNIINAALEIRDYLLHRQESGIKWKCRIGIHSGTVVGGVVGIKKYLYDVFGDAINTTSRMEDHGEPQQINVSEATYSLLKDEYNFMERKTTEVKGKGMMKMYFVSHKITSGSLYNERRKSPRVKVNTPVNLIIHKETIPCEVVDMAISGGVLLRTSKRVFQITNHDLNQKKVMITVDPLGENTSYEGRIVRYSEDEVDTYFAVMY